MGILYIKSYGQIEYGFLSEAKPRRQTPLSRSLNRMSNGNDIAFLSLRFCTFSRRSAFPGYRLQVQKLDQPTFGVI